MDRAHKFKLGDFPVVDGTMFSQSTASIIDGSLAGIKFPKGWLQSREVFIVEEK